MVKRWQVESFAVVLRRLAHVVRKPLRIVDFGCGTGTLLLPLAHMFQHCSFVGVEMKPAAVALLQERARAAGLANVRAVRCMIEEYVHEPFDVCLALHACGNATDAAMLLAVKRRAAYVVSPCCVGKLKFSLAGGSSFSPSQATYTPHMPGERPVADQNHSSGTTGPAADRKDGGTAVASAAARMCKEHIELDRNLAAEEEGYRTGLLKCFQWEAMAKNDLLVGVPAERSEWAGLVEALHGSGGSMA
ncbi:hypothetical protein GPECTOR_70g461 [Gonium pectorale]|uniref:Methyltransferase domain-containing protein n=1 Tax=Gonium pectorale TaxID=33097 RepID=A0A150G364_GONPE|nr:hypothetical protein GPECTOR_70g461 [Gonium pectorale]|eukprot:KXZ44231.1 hypothetical protein GPECTOR_70g461 [Gonium pectorale]